MHRDEQLLILAYELGGAKAQQLLSTLSCAAVTGYRRLGLLAHHGWLLARRAPAVHGAGPSFSVFTLGERGADLVANRLGLPAAIVARRARQDARRSLRIFDHKLALVDIRLALRRACQEHRYSLVWRSDEDLAAAKLTASDGSTTLPLQPDAFLAISRPVVRDGETRTQRACFFLEHQDQSRPAAFARKCRIYMAYNRAHRMEQDFQTSSLRVLTTTTGGVARVQHHLHAALQVGGGNLFWAATLEEVLATPLGAVWSVAGEGQRWFSLFGDALTNRDETMN